MLLPADRDGLQVRVRFGCGGASSHPSACQAAGPIAMHSKGYALPSNVDVERAPAYVADSEENSNDRDPSKAEAGRDCGR